MQLIPEWKRAPSMWVVQILATIALVQGVWLELPPELLADVPPKTVHYVTAALALLGVVARVIRQFYDDPGFPDTQPMEKP